MNRKPCSDGGGSQYCHEVVGPWLRLFCCGLGATVLSDSRPAVPRLTPNCSRSFGQPSRQVCHFPVRAATDERARLTTRQRSQSNGGGRGTGEQAIARPSGAASDCGPARASASQCKLARASAGKQARANASQRETARSSASQREQTRARGSHRKRELARGAWGGAYRANARRKGANDPHILNFFLKGGLSQNFPSTRYGGNPLFTRKKRPIEEPLRAKRKSY